MNEQKRTRIDSAKLIFAMVVVLVVALVSVLCVNSATTLTVDESITIAGKVFNVTSVKESASFDDNLTITVQNNASCDNKQGSVTLTATERLTITLTVSGIAVTGTATLSDGKYTLDTGSTLIFTVTDTAKGKSGTVKFTKIELPEMTLNLNVNKTQPLDNVAPGKTFVQIGTGTKIDCTGGIEEQKFSNKSVLSFTSEPTTGYEVFAWKVTLAGGSYQWEIGKTYTAAADSFSKDVTVEPFYIKTGGIVFQVGATYYRSLQEAVAVAENDNANDPIVLVKSATLPAGDYTIPKDETLLIPFDAKHTLYTTSPECNGTGGSNVVAYCTLTLAEGANLTINGSLSLSAEQSALSMYGTNYSCGNVSMINMSANSSITVNNGGALYAYGYIIGSGTVTAKSGSTVYEVFTFADYRGGSCLMTMRNNDKKVFPMSQYYIQNITVPLTLESGASEYAVVTVSANGYMVSSVPFIGSSGAMFNLASGSVVKTYDGSTDRMILDIDGTFYVNTVTLSFESYSFSSSSYVLPLNGNITVNILSGTTTIKYDLALLPGAEINIAEGATVTLEKGVNVYVYDLDDWGTYCQWCNSDRMLITTKNLPAKNYTRTEADLKDAKIEINGTFDASAGYLHSTSAGANICSSGKGELRMNTVSGGTTYQATQDGKVPSYTPIGTVSAVLQNADGTIVETSGETYYYHPGCGVWSTNAYAPTEVVVDPTCVDQGYTEGTCAEHNKTGKYAYTDPLGHTEEIDAAVEPTCTETGLTEGKHCSVCEVVLEEQTVVDALGHTEGQWTKGENGYEVITCTVCSVELDRRLESVLTLEYRLNDYIWMNAIVTIPAEGKVSLIDETNSIELVDAGNGTYYLVRKVLSTDLTTEFKVTLSIGEYETQELDLSFETFANSLPADHAHKALVNAMLDYGKAADDYFDEDEEIHFGSLASFGENAPVSNLKGQFRATNDYNGAQLKTIGAAVDFANCIGLTLRFKMTENISLGGNDKIVQIGFLVGEGDNNGNELTVEQFDRAYIYFGTNSGEVNGSENAIGDISGSVSGLVDECPDDLSQEMRLRFDLTNDEYTQQFALRPFLVIDHGDGTYTNLYGEQYLYGLEDYCARTYANAGYGTKEKNLAVYAWKYALAASEAEFDEGE